MSRNATPVKRRVYGSTRRNLIVDARPKLNALANRATGGGIEDVNNYAGTGEVPVEKVLLNIQNIHVMRSSLDK
ncbi:phosphatidylinositol-3-phosphatase ymr1, partial [Teratosphaeriaceae sp. CCFEE 6253]